MQSNKHAAADCLGQPRSLGSTFVVQRRYREVRTWTSRETPAELRSHPSRHEQS